MRKIGIESRRETISTQSCLLIGNCLERNQTSGKMSKQKYSSGHSRRGGKKRKLWDTEDLGGPSQEQYNASCLVKMFVRDLQPLSMMEGTGFRALLRELKPGLSIRKRYRPYAPISSSCTNQ
ncbi:hypothetical protein GJAV_G00265690 [Gymnothorax javanicus]|nr:hypothetical protein GJAV_G00265690 [Gymnothorax javanicus]